MRCRVLRSYPAGIAQCLAEPLPFIRVVVNQREFPLWSLKETTAATALLAGYQYEQPLWQTGMGLTLDPSVRYRWSRRVGHPTDYTVKWGDASLDTVVTDGDVITFTRYGRAECPLY